MNRSKELTVLERIEKSSKEALCPVVHKHSLIKEGLGDLTFCLSLLIPMCPLQKIKRLRDVLAIVSGPATTTCKFINNIRAKEGQQAILR